MAGMGRTSSSQLGIAVGDNVSASGDIDLRSASGCVVALATGAGGTYEIHTRVGSNWRKLQDGETGGAITVRLATGGAFPLPDEAFACGLVRLVGVACTVDTVTKS